MKWFPACLVVENSGKLERLELFELYLLNLKHFK